MLLLITLCICTSASYIQCWLDFQCTEHIMGVWREHDSRWRCMVTGPIWWAWITNVSHNWSNYSRQCLDYSEQLEQTSFRPLATPPDLILIAYTALTEGWWIPSGLVQLISGLALWCVPTDPLNEWLILSNSSKDRITHSSSLTCCTTDPGLSLSGVDHRAVRC